MIKNEYGRYEMSPLPEVKSCKLFVLGEYPNITEMKEGEYFISHGADVLKKALLTAGVPWDTVGKSMAVPYLISKKTKEVPVERWAKEQQRVFKEIRDSGAKVVMPLGTFATQMLLNTPDKATKAVTMKKVLGNIFTLPNLPGVQIIPNYHPAALMHNPGNYKSFDQVINTCVLLASGGTIGPGETDWYMVETAEQLSDLITTVSTLPKVAADMEASDLDTKKALIWNLGIAVGKNKVAVLPRETIIKYHNQVQLLFTQPCKWIWHHGKFDTKLTAWHSLIARLDEDTIYKHYVLNETSGTHGLGQLATMYLGADEYKSEMNSEFSNITKLEDYRKWKTKLCERVAIDADYTYQIDTILTSKLEENPKLQQLYYELLIPAANFLRRVEMRGMKVNVPYLESKIPEYEKKISDITTMIEDAAAPFWNPDVYKDMTGAKTASAKFKPTSVKQLRWLIYDKLKLKPTARGAIKNQATGVEALESIEKAPEFILKILELRSLKKEYSTYVKSYLKLKDENDIVHPTFNLHTTATGRLSCTEPNVQNVPSKKPDLRRSFIPRGENRILMEVDYSGAELRVLAYLSGDVGLTKALVEGDMHSEVAEMLFGPDFTKVQRGIAKTVNFGIAYGRGASDLSATFGVTLEEAQSWIDNWAKLYPKAWAYLQSCGDAVEKGLVLTTVYNRHRRFGLIHQDNLHDLTNEAKNFRVQSTSSDNTLTAAMAVDETLEKEYNAYIVNLIHDSILIDCPADLETVRAVSNLMADTMIDIPIRNYDCKVPFKVDVDMGINWGDFFAYDRVAEVIEYKRDGEKVELSYEDWYREVTN